MDTITKKPVCFVRFVSGEACLAGVETVGHEVILHSPAGLAQIPQPPTGEPKLGLVDFLPFAEPTHKDITVLREHILYQHPIPTELENAYNTMFGSNLILPPGGGRGPLTLGR